MTAELKGRAWRLWRSGWNTLQIAKCLGVPEAMIERALHEQRETQR